MDRLRPLRIALFFVSLGLLACLAFAAPPTRVSSGADDGAGSLREALASGATRILISPSVAIIEIESTLEYDGTEPLEILGSGQTIAGDRLGETLLRISQGADLTIRDLDFTDGGGFSALDPADGSGIEVVVPADRNGTVSVSLSRVSVYGVSGHGIWVADNAESPASIRGDLRNVAVVAAGTGAFDRDGVRYDETGEGDIVFRAVASVFEDAGADGVELDERGDGDVVVEIVGVSFEANGDYCEGQDVEAPIDPSCVEDGELDLDDGMDIDEADAGSVRGRFVNLAVNDNLDEGLDLDEEGPGGFLLDFVAIEASGNNDEGIKVSEEDGGDVEARLSSVACADNGNDGIEIEEEDAGNLAVQVNGTVTFDNSNDGIAVSQEAPGVGSLRVRGSNIGGGIDADGVDVDQK